MGLKFPNGSDVTTHSALGSPPSISNKENSPKVIPIGQSDGHSSLSEVLHPRQLWFASSEHYDSNRNGLVYYNLTPKKAQCIKFKENDCQSCYPSYLSIAVVNL